MGRKVNGRYGSLISLTYEIGIEILLWVMEYEIEILMYFLKCRVNPWSGRKGWKIMSIVSLSIKGGSKENIAQVDKQRKKICLSIILREASMY